MKLQIIVITGVLLVALYSCKKEKTCNCSGASNGIVGEWRLVEVLFDPGDGSGTFQSVASNKEIKFCDNGTFESNGNMCTMSSEADSTTYGTYDTSAETFAPDNCMMMPPMAYFYSVDGDTLLLRYPCIEPCQQKYVRI